MHYSFYRRDNVIIIKNQAYFLSFKERRKYGEPIKANKRAQKEVRRWSIHERDLKLDSVQPETVQRYNASRSKTTNSWTKPKMFAVIHSTLRWCSFGFVCFCIIKCNISERRQTNSPLKDRFTVLEHGKLLNSCKTPSFGSGLEDLFLLFS